MEIKAVASNIARVKAGAIIVNHFEELKHPEGHTASVDEALGGAISQLIKQGEIKGKLDEITVLHSLGKLPASHIVVSGLGRKSKLSINNVRGAVAETCRLLRKKGITDIVTVAQGAGINGISPESSGQAITEGALLGLYAFRKHITRKNREFGEVKRLLITGTGKERPQLEQGITRGRILSEAVNWARDMVNEPANYMTPDRMAVAALEIAKNYGLSVEVMEREQIEAAGMGGLLGVSQGSKQPPKFIILNYKGSDYAAVDIALVGKGITFDSGGISIKPSDSMKDMKGDMAGGAAVMSTLIALSQLKPKMNVTAIVPATENMPGGSALKPGDIISAMNGKTIEVLNTDAEGRLILADALSYATKLGAKYIIDVATLTGACMVALGPLAAGAFSNNQRLANMVIAAGNQAGELIWQLPMYDEYKEQLKSNMADIKNIGNRYGGAITGAIFLAEFIDNIPWVHLDIAGPKEIDKDKGYLVKGATGIPVRTLVNLVLAMANK